MAPKSRWHTESVPEPERYSNIAANLTEAEALLQEYRQDRQHKQSHFLETLGVYPVEQLRAAQSLQDNREAAQTLLGVPL